MLLPPVPDSTPAPPDVALSMMDYATIFDMSTLGFRYWWLLGPFLFVIAVDIAFLCILRSYYRRGRRIARPEILLVGALFALMTVVTGVVLFRPLGQYLAAQAVANRSLAKFTEGRIHEFHPPDPATHAPERFSVNGIEFTYSDYDLNAGYNVSTTHGSPLRQGLPVRIWYYHGSILKLQIAPDRVRDDRIRMVL